MTPINTIYNEMGIRETVLSFGNTIEKDLKKRFEKIDKIAEYNQLKVVKAMQDNRVSAGCFNYASGYGYDDQGRDTLEKVYASIFHTESALVRPQITCGTHALALALAANLRPVMSFWHLPENHMIHWKKSSVSARQMDPLQNMALLTLR